MPYSSRFIKRSLGKLLGQERAQFLIDKVKGRTRSFSEADLVWRYFEKPKLRGVMVDVGAHFGESCGRYLDQGWEVFAFEPDPKNRKILQERHPSPRLRISPLAVSDREEVGISFFSSAESSGISSLSAFHPTHEESAKVDVTTLALFLAQNHPGSVNFLKIDTEGHDLFTLRGFPWDRVSPNVVLCEFEDRKTEALGYTYRDMGDFLIEQGYRVLLSEWKPIERYGVAHEWNELRDYPCELEDKAAWGNFIAYRDGTFRSIASTYVQEFGRKL